MKIFTRKYVLQSTPSIQLQRELITRPLFVLILNNVIELFKYKYITFNFDEFRQVFCIHCSILFFSSTAMAKSAFSTASFGSCFNIENNNYYLVMYTHITMVFRAKSDYNRCTVLDTRFTTFRLAVSNVERGWFFFYQNVRFTNNGAPF